MEQTLLTKGRVILVYFQTMARSVKIPKQIIVHGLIFSAMMESQKRYKNLNLNHRSIFWRKKIMKKTPFQYMNSSFQDPQQSVMLTKYSSQCNFSLFWYTSLACDPEKQAIEPRGNKADSCKVSIPIYDQILDLKVLSAKIGYSVNAGTNLKILMNNSCQSLF